MPSRPAYNERVRLSRIDCFDDSFRVSKKRPLDGLRASIERFGLLEPPVLLNRKDGMVPVFGHNRLLAAGEAGLDLIEALVVEEIDPVDYRKRALLKCGRNEAGPAGRIRMARILRGLWGEGEECDLTMRHGLGLPDEFASELMMDSVLGLPARLRDYIDTKDVGFKVVRSLLALPVRARDFLDERLDGIDFRVNIFKGIVEMLQDISARDGTLEQVFLIPRGQSGDRRRDEQILFDAVYALRYPLYVSMREKAAKLSAEIERGGCSVALPPYFEGGEISLCFGIKKGDGIETIRRRLSGIDVFRVEELLELL